ncbi:MAG: hypothetical protein WBA77_07495 [Microcoleaceae cyanobacterium]
MVYVFICLAAPFSTFLRNRSIENQITYLSDILDDGYDDELQLRFPEGKLFSNSILALSAIEFCERNNIVDTDYSTVVDNCIKRIQSDGTLSIFSRIDEPKYGMFYNGWANYVYSVYKKSKLFQYSSIQERVNQESRLIEERLVSEQADSLRILDSYNGASWPADNFIGIISLENNTVREDWVNSILNSTDHSPALVHHSGSNRSIIRGSSSAMITFCLSRLDFEEVYKYNRKYSETFIDEFLGIQLVKENSDGSNKMDFDSGPVVFGYGASATIMNIKTQASLNNEKSKFTWSAMNLISIPVNIFGKKYYLMKQEPMFDLFMLWGCVELN